MVVRYMYALFGFVYALLELFALEGSVKYWRPECRRRHDHSVIRL